MNKTTKTTLRASALVLGLIATSAFAGIADTRHNLSTGGFLKDISKTDEICVFCHTPHASSTTLVAPLWNKALPNASSYKVYSSGTMQGTANLTSSSASLACLSCHDGTQAMDNMINRPGSSGYNSSGQSLDGMNYFMPSASGTFIANLGTDLTNDHPVGIPYAGGECSQVGTLNGCRDRDFQAPKENGSGNGYMVGNSSVQKENMRLYGTSLPSATVECASCHDPHISTTKTFLRVNNAGSAVCLTCHAK
ncbi:MAG: cytochrome c3 family protein [Gallionellaceae bacterium]|nr:cytochrome c3 family protein [Gallionellaceae bacterium]